MSSPSSSARRPPENGRWDEVGTKLTLRPSKSPSTVHAFLTSVFAAWSTSPFSLDVALLPAPGTPPPLLSP